MLNVIILKEILKKECQIQVNNFHRDSWFAIILPKNLNGNFYMTVITYSQVPIKQVGPIKLV